MTASNEDVAIWSVTGSADGAYNRIGDGLGIDLEAPTADTLFV